MGDLIENSLSGGDALFDLGSAPIPKAIESEQAILGGLLADKDAPPLILGRLKEHHFHQPAHQIIFRAVVELHSQGELVDIVSVSDMLLSFFLKDGQYETLLDRESDAQLAMYETIGGRPYINDLAVSFVTLRSIDYHISQILDKFSAREMLKLSTALAQCAIIEGGAQAIALAQSASAIIQAESDSTKDRPMSEFLSLAVEQIKTKRQTDTEFSGLSCAFNAIDGVVGGLKPNSSNILAARPAMGKTALALNIGINLAKQGKRVLFVTLEMSGVEIAERAIRSILNSQGRIELIQQAADKIEKLPFEIVDRYSLNPLTLESLIAKKKAEHGGIDLIIVDYLQLMDAEGRDQHTKVSNISRSLKLIARKYDVVMLTLAQLSRALESRQDKRPMLSDLRDSGSIEQDADCVMFLYREEYYNKATDKVGVAEVIVAKNRHGATETANLYFIPKALRFTEAKQMTFSEQTGGASNGID